MYAKTGGYNNNPKIPTKAPGGGRGAGENVPLYDADELDVLRDELLEAYSSPREHIITHDELTQIKRTELAIKESQRLTFKKEKDETTLLKIKAKQDALKRLYENVILEKERREKKQKRKTSGSTRSSHSFHKMYTVIHDPTNISKAKFIRGHDQEDDAKDDVELEKAASDDVVSLKVVEAKVPLPIPPSKVGESDKLTESSGKERSKFVLKNRLSPLKSKPPPLLEGMNVRTSREMRSRKDARYSDHKDRFSFDVDVYGPFFRALDLKKRPRMRTVATQVYMVDDIRKSTDLAEIGSQTEFEVGSWSDRRTSKTSDRSRRTSQGYDGLDFQLAEDEEEEEYEEQAGGDASSSNPSEVDEDEEAEDEDKGKILERKESKRREAETMARPRGYRGLDLGEPLPYVSFEAETHVTAHDLEREEAKRKGFVLTRDNVLWPTCSEFDIDTAGKKIEDYIKRCWALDPKWLFVIQPLEVYHDSYRKKYVFEVKFSIPSPTTPVPPATASVFFVFEIPIYSMKDDMVKVSYVLEGTRFPHIPGKIRFQDKWLWGIISDKLRVQKTANL